MKKLVKAGIICASFVLVVACLAGCGGNNSSSSSSSSSSASSSSSVQTVTLKEVTVAGIEMDVPSDMGPFNYVGSGSLYMAQSENNNSAITVSELIEAEGTTLAGLDQNFITTTLLSGYTDVNWSSFETDRNQAPSVNYNYGIATAKAATGGDVNIEVKFYMYEDLACQFVMTIVSPGKGAQLESCASEVMKSLNPDNTTMADYLVAWAVYNVAGLDTAQLSEPENLAAANELIQQAMASDQASSSSAATIMAEK